MPDALINHSGKKIVIVTSNAYIPQLYGGSERSSEAIASFLKEQGHNVSILCGLLPGGFIGLWNRFRRKYLNIDFPKDNIGNTPVYRCWREDGSIVKHIKRFISLNGADLALVQAGSPFSLARELRNQSIPVLVFIRDVEFSNEDGKPPSDNRTRYIANSQFTAHRFKEAFDIDVSAVIPPTVIPSNYKVTPEAHYILMVNPVEEKGVGIAIDIAKMRSDIPIVFLESWNLEPEIRNELLIAIKDVPNISLRPPTNDMKDVYKGAKLILAPSRWEEAWGRVITEGHVSGIPAIATSIGGLPESVGPGGILINRDASIEAWVQAISEIWDHPSRYQDISKRAFEYSLRDEIQPNYAIKVLNTEINMLLADITQTI